MFDPRCHQTTAIDHHYDALVPFDLKLFSDQMAAPRRRRPGDMSNFIAAHVIAQALEFSPLPSDLCPAMPAQYLTAALRRQFVTARLVDVRINFYSHRSEDSRLFDDQVPGRIPAKDEVSKTVITA